ncbi:MAG: beta-ketoacyl-ACP synthase II [Candidatus Omnitrophica bacterium]|nr:beta-ketoacyl-ACP synthase II [Candidatus Omnitrophota bacterium]
MERKRVVITGLGAITPIGADVKSFWEGITHGRSGIGPITHFDCSAFDAKIAGEVSNFDPSPFLEKKDIKRMERFVQFAVCAAEEAWRDSGLHIDEEDPYRVGTVIGSGIGSLGIIEAQHDVLRAKGPSRLSPFLIPMLIVNMAPGQVSIRLGIKGPNSCAATACATGNHAIGDALLFIRNGMADVMVAGGTESCITELGIGGFCAMKALSTRNAEPQKASRPFDRERDGFVMSEGSGIVILEELEHARRRRAHIYGEIVGFGLTGDAYHMTAPAPTGEGAACAMKFALQDGRLNPEDVDYINAHGTSTQLNDKIETLAIKTVFKDHVRRLKVSSTKSMTGHLLGAAGGIEFVISALAITQGVYPPTINYEYPDPECDLDYVPNEPQEGTIRVALSNALGFGGHNAALVVKAFEA